MSRRPMVRGMAIWVAAVLAAAGADSAEHRVGPGEPPQPILDAAAAGDTVVFLPGLHQHGLGRHRAMLFVEKPISIELCAGATLKLDDLEVGGEFDLRRPSVFTIRIDGEGRPAAAGQPASPDTFAWGVFHDVINPDGGAAVAASTSRFNETPHTGIPITGDWQDLGQGVKVRFGGTTGHNKGSTWFVSYDGPEAYGIRIGHGTQPHSIDNVRITGLGTIDMNAGRNVQPSFLVKDINACVLVHGRVRNVLIQGITMVDTNRSVMCYGEHTGEFLPGGGVIADNLRIHDNTGQPVVVLGAPKGWKAPEPPVLRDNRNPLSDAAAARAAHRSSPGR